MDLPIDLSNTMPIDSAYINSVALTNALLSVITIILMVYLHLYIFRKR